jgi:N-acetylglucosamine kinase-like BadF-type ATPase
MTVLGIDAGGTRTVCLLADERGTILSQARSAGANLQSAGEEGVQTVLRDVMDQAIGDGPTPDAICLGVAGVDREEDAEAVRSIMARIGRNARVLVVNDALIALVAGVGDAPGIVLVAGTGSIAYGRNEQNQAARSGGWGHVLADEGSGYWMGLLALRAVVRQADGRDRATRLTEHVLAHFKVARAPDLIYEVYRQPLAPSAIAALAVYIQPAANEGDAVAQEILTSAAGELAAAAHSVARLLSLERTEFPLVLAGGVMRTSPWLVREVSQRVARAVPGARPQKLDVEPAVGAVHLALAEARGGAQVPTYL